jgi:hypothetical protein
MLSVITHADSSAKFACASRPAVHRSPWTQISKNPSCTFNITVTVTEYGTVHVSNLFLGSRFESLSDVGLYQANTEPVMLPTGRSMLSSDAETMNEFATDILPSRTPPPPPSTLSRLQLLLLIMVWGSPPQHGGRAALAMLKSNLLLGVQSWCYFPLPPPFITRSSWDVVIIVRSPVS